MIRRRGEGVAALLAAVCALIVGVLLLARVPGAVAEERRFSLAVDCPAAASRPATECIGTARLTVTAVRAERQGKNMSYSAHLAGAAEGSGWVPFESDGPVFKRLREGDEVTVRVWHHKIVAVTYSDASQRTRNDPADLALYLTGFGLVLVSLVGWALVSGWCRLRHPLRCDGRHRPTPVLAKWTSTGLAAGTFAVMCLLIAFDEPGYQVWLLSALWAMAAALVVACRPAIRQWRAGL